MTPDIFQFYNVDTRRLARLEFRCTQIAAVEAQLSDKPDLSWVFGWHDPALYYVNENGEVASIGDGGPLDPAKTGA